MHSLKPSLGFRRDMASKYPNGSDNDSSNNLDMTNVGHTLTEDIASQNSDKENKIQKKKLRRVRKVIVEKRPRSTSESSDQDDSNVKKKII